MPYMLMRKSFIWKPILIFIPIYKFKIRCFKNTLIKADPQFELQDIIRQFIVQLMHTNYKILTYLLTYSMVQSPS